MSEKVCKDCGITLSEQNQYPSCRKRGQRACKKCWKVRCYSVPVSAHRTCFECGKTRTDTRLTRSCPTCVQRKRYVDPIWRQKRQAVDALNYAVRRELIKRQPCEVCGETKVDGHHHDYSRPLEVRWLCHKHHMEIHHPSTTQ